MLLGEYGRHSVRGDIMSNEMKANTFPKVTDDGWRKVAEESLRGRSLTSLETKTYEGITLKPLYTKSTLKNDVGNEHEKMLTSIRMQKQTASWKIAQMSYATTGEQFLHETKQLIEAGNEAVVYDGALQVSWTDEVLQELTKLVKTHPIYAWNVKKLDRFNNIFSLITNNERRHVTGIVATEKKLPAGFDNIRTKLINIVPYHLQGADAVLELALALAYLEAEASTFNSFSDFSEQVVVRFAIDTHFFMELAKLRAFRVLWHMFAEAYGEMNSKKIPVIAETSLRSYTKMDPYVNLLRGGNELFSAVLGGADIITVHPHNILSGTDRSSLRYAKNMQLVLREETFVDKVVDPAGGSYFIDTLTNELIQRSWEKFLTIIEQGGIEGYKRSGELQTELEKVKKHRFNDLNTRRKSLIGTNIYAQPDETISEDDYVNIEGRIAEQFERLRIILQQSKLTVALLSLGELKDAKALFDFVSGTLAPFSINISEQMLFPTTVELISWLQSAPYDYYVICLHDKVGRESKQHLLSSQLEEKWIDIAQFSFSEDEKRAWQKVGMTSFYYKGMDLLKKGEEILSCWQKVNGGALK